MLSMATSRSTFAFIPLMAVTLACAGPAGPSTPGVTQHADTHRMTTDTSLATVYLGAGCFWCVEAVFEELKGVVDVSSGYMGGHVKEPTYKQVCTGNTGHAEVVKLVYDPTVLSFDEVLEVFWMTHDPTTKDRQGADVGSQYRSAVFFTTPEQEHKALAYRNELDKSGAFPAPIVTEIVAASVYYPAEDYHQDYYAQNPDQGYCRMVVRPKLEKFRKVFADKLK
jgi:peptide-methionine (S)-S-oxide reductase